MRGGTWFSLFFWPAFRRIFLLDKKPEIWPTPGGSLSASSSSQLEKNRLITCRASTVPRIVIETQIEHWIRCTLESNIALAAVLKAITGFLQAAPGGKDCKRCR